MRTVKEQAAQARAAGLKRFIAGCPRAGMATWSGALTTRERA
jgi:hypothetical protein